MQILKCGIKQHRHRRRQQISAKGLRQVHTCKDVESPDLHKRLTQYELCLTGMQLLSTQPFQRHMPLLGSCWSSTAALMDIAGKCTTMFADMMNIPHITSFLARSADVQDQRQRNDFQHRLFHETRATS